ncbi:hypothetical protein [Kineococcus sp. SYSU DK004]|uniref:hypothetical protein n=1 Tax=Kineococcus sp. SYSU DK004 TaxID=3383125 RepID=UPI003D7D93A5
MIFGSVVCGGGREGWPDHWWGGHDFDVWWSWLPGEHRAELLELGHGDQPPIGQWLRDLRGATELLPTPPERPRELGRSLPPQLPPRALTHGFRVWLEELQGLHRREVS